MFFYRSLQNFGRSAVITPPLEVVCTLVLPPLNHHVVQLLSLLQWRFPHLIYTPIVSCTLWTLYTCSWNYTTIHQPLHMRSCHHNTLPTSHSTFTTTPLHITLLHSALHLLHQTNPNIHPTENPWHLWFRGGCQAVPQLPCLLWEVSPPLPNTVNKN